MSKIVSKKSSRSQNIQPYDCLAKIAIIGDSSVGKTNILLRYVDNQHQMSHITTVGIDFKVRTVIFDGFRIKMQIWDTAGQERFRNLSGTIYQGAEAIILVYSIENRRSFQNVEKWVQDTTDKTKGNIILAIAGNKSDLHQQREVSTQEGEQIAKKFNANIFMETSAKEGTNIDQLFQKIGIIIKQKFQKSKENILNEQNNSKKSKTKSKEQDTDSVRTNRHTVDEQQENQRKKGQKLKVSSSKQNKKKNCC